MYGLMSIGMAFFAGMIGSVLKVNLSNQMLGLLGLKVHIHSGYSKA